MAEQLRLKRGCHIIVGTRTRSTISMKKPEARCRRNARVDEADELRMSFIEEVTSIIEQTPPERQTVLFSATMPGAIAKLRNGTCNHHRNRIKTKNDGRCGRQFFIPITGSYKDRSTRAFLSVKTTTASSFSYEREIQR